jgi:hypothetical protein
MLRLKYTYMKHIIALLMLQLIAVSLYSQECKDYWNQSSVTINNDNYTIVPEACFSKLLATDESFEIPFDLIQCKDYRMALFTSFRCKAYITLYDRNDGKLIYNNILNDTAQIIEFQILENTDVRAIVSLPNLQRKKVVGTLTAKPTRYCVGLKLESMTTRR